VCARSPRVVRVRARRSATVKLEILTFLVDETNISKLLREFQVCRRRVCATASHDVIALPVIR
jgi:hypothetical protein